MEIDIEKIKEGPNPRKDFGDLSELAASIRVHGIIEPVILDGKNILFDGARRLRAAKMVGLKTVPYVIRERKTPAIDKAVSLVANVQRTDLTAFEEGEAYKGMLQAYGTIKQLAAAVGKSPQYIERRLSLLKLGDKALAALKAGKIELGHAVILATLDPKQQEEDLRDLFREMSWGNGKSVKKYANDVQERSEEAWIPIENAKFDASKPCGPECPTCHGKPKENNLQQTLLQEAGAEVSKKGVMLAGCFKRRQKEWLEAQKAKIKAKGVTLIDAIPQSAKRVSEYDDDFQAISKEGKGKLYTQPEVFALHLAVSEHGGIERQIVCLQPALRHETKKVSAEKAVAEADRQRNLKGKEQLEKNLQVHWHSLLVERTLANSLDKKHVNTHHAKALVLYELIEKLEGTPNRFEDLAKQLKLKEIKYNESFEDIVKMDDAVIDRLTAVISTEWVGRMDGPELERVAKVFGFDIKKDFVMTEEYLKPHTIRQLEALAKELGLHNLTDPKAKTEWIAWLLKNWKPSMVPKAMLNGKDLKEPVRF